MEQIYIKYDYLLIAVEQVDSFDGNNNNNNLVYLIKHSY